MQSLWHGMKIRTWIVEAVAILAAIWLWDQGSLILGFLPGLLVLVYFGIVGVIDLEHRLIPHPLSLAGSLLGLVIGTWQHGLLPTLLGCLAGFGTMLVLYLFGELFVKIFIRRRRPDFEDSALGFGDVILGGVLGLFIGWPGIVLALIAGILIGGVGVFLYLIASLVLGRYRSFDFVPYGPFLLAGAFFALFFQDFLLALLT
jgi:leader peptidase (prepilin peptidase)/N-methyltransferase